MDGDSERRAVNRARLRRPRLSAHRLTEPSRTIWMACPARSVSPIRSCPGQRERLRRVGVLAPDRATGYAETGVLAAPLGPARTVVTAQRVHGPACSQRVQRAASFCGTPDLPQMCRLTTRTWSRRPAALTPVIRAVCLTATGRRQIQDRDVTVVKQPPARTRDMPGSRLITCR